MLRFSACLVLTSAATTTFSFAGILTPLSSTRLVTATNHETLPETSTTVNGPLLGSWQQSLSIANLQGQPNYSIAGSSLTTTITQQSGFSSSGVTFSGRGAFDYGPFNLVPPNNGGFVRARCDALFHIDGPLDYQLNSTVTTPFGLFGLINATVTLGFTGGATLFTSSATGSIPGTLQTGDYTLSILLQGTTSGSTLAYNSSRQVDLSFTVPAPTSALPLMAVCGGFTLRRRRQIGSTRSAHLPIK